MGVEKGGGGFSKERRIYIEEGRLTPISMQRIDT